jgi:predicted DNA-binding transcriptional regulator YafY
MTQEFKMADSGLRLLLLLKKIPRTPKKITTKQLVSYIADEGYHVTERTIQRDILILSTQGFPIIQTAPEGKGKEGVGWAFTKDSPNIGIPVMEPSTALTLLMGIDHLKQILPQQVLAHLQPFKEEAQNTLKIFNKRSFDKWPDKVRIIPSTVLKPPSIAADCINTIYEALLDNKQFTATYNDRDDQVVSPYGIVQRGNNLYLLCKFFKFDDIRITALHRFSHVTLLDSLIKPDPSFDIDAYITSGEMLWPWAKNATKEIKLKLHVNSWLHKHLTESPLSNNQTFKKAEDKGWYLLNATVLDTHELRWWILSQGDSIEVLSPVSMRKWFTEISENMHGYYHSN